MSYSTYFQFLNENDPAFVRSRDSGSPKDLEEWEDEHGPIRWAPGAPVRCTSDCIEETDEEYGGWIIDLSKVPANATHLHVSRG